MTQFLLRILLKNKNQNDPSVRAAIGQIAGYTGIGCNFFLFLGKIIAGLLVGSIAIIADAVNNLSDAVSSVVTLLGFRLARRPADQDHPFGHARYEYLAGLIVAELILLVGFELGKSSIDKILHPEDIPFQTVTFVVLIISILVKLWMSGFYHTLGRLIQSGTLEATSADSRNDVIATTAVLISCLVSRLWGLNIDGIAGFAVAVFIFWSGIQIAQDTISPLLGMRADGELIEALTELICSHDKVLGVHDLLVHDYGPGQCFASVHAEMDADADSLEAHDLLEHIESQALEDMNVHLVIHYDPVATKNAQWNSLRTQTEQAVTQVDPCLSIHDFRILHEGPDTKIAFDLNVPYDFSMEDSRLQQLISASLSGCGVTCPTVIHIDRNG